MKDFDRGAHEGWCDCMNKISETCNCIVSGYIERIEELEKEIKQLKCSHDIDLHGFCRLCEFTFSVSNSVV